MNYTIDVAHYDTYTGRILPSGQFERVAIDWQKTGFPLAIIKSSQETFADSGFELQWKAAEGLPRIAYHYFKASVNAIKQAQFQKNLLSGRFTENDYVAVDYEPDIGNRIPGSLMALGSFLYEMEKDFVPANRIFIYTGKSFWYEMLGHIYGLWAKKYRYWQAIYPWELSTSLKVVWTADQIAEKKALIESGKVKPPQTLPWDMCDIWQWTSRFDPKQIPGYKANKLAVDYNVIYMELEPPVPPTYCPTCGQIIPS